MESITSFKEDTFKRYMVKGVLLLLALLFLFPILWLLFHSFMPPDEVMAVYGGGRSSGVRILPSRFSLIPYYEIFLATPKYLYKFWKSLGIVLAILAGQMILSCTAGAAFSHYKFRGHSFWFVLLILFTFLPVQAVLVPDYWLLSQLNLTDTDWALILPNIFSPLGVVLITTIYNNVPRELLEAARLDGAKAVEILLYILVPCGKPGIASLFVISFADCWNMVEQPMVFLGNARDYPLSVFLAVMNEQNISQQFACAVLCFIPITLLFLFFHNELSEGITSAITK